MEPDPPNLPYPAAKLAYPPVLEGQGSASRSIPSFCSGSHPSDRASPASPAWCCEGQGSASRSIPSFCSASHQKPGTSAQGSACLGWGSQGVSTCETSRRGRKELRNAVTHRNCDFQWPCILVSFRVSAEPHLTGPAAGACATLRRFTLFLTQAHSSR